jgi:hypothetical protein
LHACRRRLHGAAAHRIKASRMIMVNCVVYPEYLFASGDSLECNAFGVAAFVLRRLAFGSAFASVFVSVFVSAFEAHLPGYETYVDYDQR